MRYLVAKRAHLRQTCQRQLLPLHGLLDLRREALVHSKFLLQLNTRVKLSIAYLPDCAVTDKATHAKDLRNNRLIVSLAEHKGDKFANSREEHNHMIHSLRCVLKRCILSLASQLLGHEVRQVILGDKSAAPSAPIAATPCLLQLLGH